MTSFALIFLPVRFLYALRKSSSLSSWAGRKYKLSSIVARSSSRLVEVSALAGITTCRSPLIPLSCDAVLSSLALTATGDISGAAGGGGGIFLARSGFCSSLACFLTIALYLAALDEL